MQRNLLNLRRSSNRPSIGTPLEVFCGQKTTLTSGGFSCGRGLSYPSLLPRAISSLSKAHCSRRWMVARGSLTMPCSCISLSTQNSYFKQMFYKTSLILLFLQQVCPLQACFQGRTCILLCPCLLVVICGRFLQSLHLYL